MPCTTGRPLVSPISPGCHVPVDARRRIRGGARLSADSPELRKTAEPAKVSWRELSMTDSETIYSERYVAFVDILGFSSIVRGSTQSTLQATKLAGILNKIASRTDPPGIDLGPGDDFQAQSFSDCTVISENALGSRPYSFTRRSYVLHARSDG